MSCIIYKKCFKPNPMSESNPRPLTEAEILKGVQTETVEKRDNMYILNNNYCGNGVASIKVATDSEGSSKPLSENANCEDGNANAEAVYPEIIIANIPAQQQPDEEEN